MSTETWKEEFYPVEAKECKKEDALEHSLRKWKGFREEALKRHEVTRDQLYSVYVRRGLCCFPEVSLSSNTSCALCQHYLLPTQELHLYCVRCPLFVRGYVGGLCTPKRGGMKSPYVWMQIFHDPEPMIAALEDCIQVEKEKKARE